MDAIITKYHGPTNSQGGRIIASRPAAAKYTDGPYRLKHPYNHALSAYENHAAAARALWAKTAPDAPAGRLVGGQLGDGWAWVLAATEETYLREVAGEVLDGLRHMRTPDFDNGAAGPLLIKLAEALGLPSSAAGL